MILKTRRMLSDPIVLRSHYNYGTYVTGNEFDGCFKGYGVLDRIITALLKEPTPFDATSSSAIYAGRRTLDIVYSMGKWIWCVFK